jgi:hypothetical protein
LPLCGEPGAFCCANSTHASLIPTTSFLTNHPTRHILEPARPAPLPIDGMASRPLTRPGTRHPPRSMASSAPTIRRSPARRRACPPSERSFTTPRPTSTNCSPAPTVCLAHWTTPASRLRSRPRAEALPPVPALTNGRITWAGPYLARPQQGVWPRECC